MRTAVITDTNSGISTEEAAEMGIRSISMPVLIDGEIYLEGVDLGSESFFTSLTEGKAVTTSQPSPGVVCSASRIFSSFLSRFTMMAGYARKMAKESKDPSTRGMDKNRMMVALYIGWRTMPYSPVSMTC